MRTTVIPAQITTVEDKIVGNLNLTQIGLLVASLFVAVFIYIALPQRMTFSIYKFPLFAIEFLIFFTLSLRIRKRVVLNWLFLLSSYYFRPSFYIADKNDIYLRDIVFEPVIKRNFKKAVSPKIAKKELEVPMFNPENVERILGISRARLSFKFEKGVLNAVWQVKK